MVRAHSHADCQVLRDNPLLMVFLSDALAA